MRRRIIKPATIQALIARGRAKRRLSQDKTAAWFGCSVRTVRHWEDGRVPHAYWVKDIARFAEVSVDVVLAMRESA